MKLWKLSIKTSSWSQYLNISIKLNEMLINAFVVFFAFMSRLERSFPEFSLAGLK